MTVTDQMTASDLKVEYTVGVGPAVDLSGYAVTVDPEGAERAWSETHVFDCDTPVMGYGKLACAKATIKAVYTQDDAEPFDDIYDAKVANDDFKLKWSVAGGAAGDKEYEVAGKVVECSPPGGEAGSADLVFFEALVVANDFDETVVAP